MKKKKRLHKHVSHVLHALIIAVLFLWGGPITASAEGSGTKDDPYVFQDGESYTVESFKGIYGKFTAPSDGELYLPYNAPTLVRYTDASFMTQHSVQPKWNNVYGQGAYTILECKSGETYYLGCGFSMDKYTFKIEFRTEALPLELVSVTPVSGSVLNMTQASIELAFNQGISIGKCTMSANDKNVSLPVNYYASNASADAKAALKKWYDDSTVKEGDEITILFEDVKASANNTMLYDGTGKLELKYKAGAKPTMLTGSYNTPNSETHPMTKLKSYYMSDDNNSIINLTFDKDISTETLPTVTLTCGNIETDKFYRETINPAVLGNTIVINLKGKVREGEAFDTPIVEGQPVYVTLKLSGVKDIDGNFVYSDDAGSIGSFTFSYEYEKVAYEVATEWTPAAESKITADTKSIELYMQETGSKAYFDGVKFDYTEKTEAKSFTVPTNQLTIETDGDAKIITIPMPNISIDANTEVTVSLTNVERPDGKTDEASMDNYKVKYTCEGIAGEEFKLNSAVWNKSADEAINLLADDASIDVLTKGSTIVLKTSMDDKIGYVTLEVRGPENAPEGGFVAFKDKSTTVYDGEGGSTIVPFTDGISFEWFGESLYEGYNYTFTLKAWKSEDERNLGLDPTVGETSFVVKGAKSSYVYSDVKLLTDISEDFILSGKDDTYRTFEFSGPVTLTAIVNTGFGTSVDCAVEKADNDGAAWKVTIPESILSEYEIINVNLFVKDLNGKAVNKTDNGLGVVMGSEDNTWFQVNFVSDFNKPDFTVDPAPDSELESISKITFIYDLGISQNWNCTEKITVYNRTDRELLYSFSGDDIELDFNDIKKAYLNLPEVITKPGTYDIQIPANFFMLGEEMMSSTSKLTTVTYVIPGSTPTPELNVTITPEAGAVPEIPAELVMAFPDYETVGYNFDLVPALKDDKAKDYAATFDYGEGWNEIKIILTEGKITADGTYTLTIPAGAITFGDDPDNINTEPIVFIYTIGTTGIDSLVTSEGGKVNVYTIDGITVLRNADAAAVKTLTKGLYIINGKKVVIR